MPMTLDAAIDRPLVPADRPSERYLRLSLGAPDSASCVQGEIGEVLSVRARKVAVEITLMNGEQAVEYGLADEVLAPQRVAVPAGR